MKQAPQHNTVGTPCNIVKSCKSGKPALYVVGKKFACADHKEQAYQMAKKQRRAEPVLPDVGTFEPEIETVEVEELEVGQFVRMAQED
jgi:hypothetical protein